jgi:hypothetical protein
MVTWFKLNELALVVTGLVFGDYLEGIPQISNAFNKYAGKFKILRVD